MREFHSPSKPSVSLSLDQLEIVKDYNSKVANRKLPLEWVPCLCGKSQFELIASVDRYSIHQKVLICTDCGLVQSNPRLTAAGYQWFYASDVYRKLYASRDFLENYQRSHYNSKMGRAIFESVGQWAPIDQNTSVMEFGAGGGWNLVPFLEAKADVLGIDYSAGLTALGEKNGIPMRQGGLEAIPDRSFDVIVLNQVFEHFLDPIASLKKILLHLKPRGVIFIAVPNIDDFTMGQLQSAHVYYFSPLTFKRYTTMAGLRPISEGSLEEGHIFGIFLKDDQNPIYKNWEAFKSYHRTRRTLKMAWARAKILTLLSRIGVRAPLRKVYRTVLVRLRPNYYS